MKGLKDLFLDESPKNIKKLEKLLAKDPGSAACFESAKAEAARDSAIEFPKLRMMVTDSYVCFLRFGIGGPLMIVPISNITNLYRTNVVNNQYDYDNFTLAVETNEGIRYMAVYPRGNNSFDIFNEVIEAVKFRMSIIRGAQL